MEQAGRGRHQAARVLPAVRGGDAAAAVVVAHLPPRALAAARAARLTATSGGHLDT